MDADAMDIDFDLDLDVDWSGLLHLPPPDHHQQQPPASLDLVPSSLDGLPPACAHADSSFGALAASFTAHPPPLLDQDTASHAAYNALAHQLSCTANHLVVVPPDRLFAEDEPVLAAVPPLFASPASLNLAPPPPVPQPSTPVASVVAPPSNSAETTNNSTGPGFLDLNDPTTLQLYDQVLLWYFNAQAENQIIFRDCLPSREVVLHGLAMRFCLSYSFDFSSRTVTIRRVSTSRPAHARSSIPTPITTTTTSTTSTTTAAATAATASISASSTSPDTTTTINATEPSPLITSPNDNQLQDPQEPVPKQADWSPDPSLSLSRASSHPSQFSTISFSSSISSPPVTPTTPATPTTTPALALTASISSTTLSQPQAQPSSHSKNPSRLLLGDSISQRVSTWKIFSGGRRSLGRKGPLNDYSRDKLRALEAVGGACWRCKVIRRKCDPGNPCKSCPAPHLGEDAPLWPIIGCRRGSLSDAMPRQSLCPKSRRPGSRSTIFGTDPDPAAMILGQVDAAANQADAAAARCLRDAEERLLSDAKEALDLGASMGNGAGSRPGRMTQLATRGNPEAAAVFVGIVTGGACRDSVSLNKRCRIRDKALTCADLITGIAWELADCRDLASLLEIDSSDRFARLLTTACMYEEEVAKSSTSLVIFSVICLRYCLDVLRLHRAGLVGPLAHVACTVDQCAITSIRVLCSYLAAYVEELSLVMFKKENLRDRRWWLSTFYSLSIQSHVRHALVAVEKELVFPSARDDDEPPPESLYSTQYLHVAAILFTAASAQYDPLLGGRLQYALTDDSVVPETSVPELHHLSARDVFEVHSWSDKGLRTSYQYLRRLLQIGSLDFEPDGGDTRMVDVGGLGLEWSSLETVPSPLPPKQEQQQQQQLEQLEQPEPPPPPPAPPQRIARSHAHAQARTLSVCSTSSVSDASLYSTWTGSTGSSTMATTPGDRSGCRNSLVSVHEVEPTATATTVAAAAVIAAATVADARPHICACCPKKPRRFRTAGELESHAGEKAHGCDACAARFRTAAEADRHRNAVHRRRDSWQCSRLGDPAAAFHSLTMDPASDSAATFDICGFCGRGFRRDAGATLAVDTHGDQLAGHVRDAHAFAGCNKQKLFYRADHFRQHLRVFHGAVSGKWMRFLERACKASEDEAGQESFV